MMDGGRPSVTPCDDTGKDATFPGVLPFTAIVGQAGMKRALLAAIVAPSLGGVLIRGQKGTAKTTAVRALAQLLPPRSTVADCVFGCDPDGPLCRHCTERMAQGLVLPIVKRPVRVIELPLGATEDRVAGSLDMERALRDGARTFQPGLLAAAHGNILYVDEVNLLDDHLVDIILDAASSGWNVVEREGVSCSHPARFILVGSMNPEEGELRPQLLDRFGLCVDVSGLPDPDDRVRLMRVRQRWDTAPHDVAASFAALQQVLAHRLAAARMGLSSVAVPASLMVRCVELALEACVAGHRADIALCAAAQALAALEGRTAITPADVDEAALYVLPHRRRMPPPPPEHDHASHDEDHTSDSDDTESQQDSGEASGDEHDEKQRGRNEEQQGDDADTSHEEQGTEDGQDGSASPEGDTQAPASPVEKVFASGDPFRVRKLDIARDRMARAGSGRRCRTRASTRMGRYVRNTPDGPPDDIALDATLRAAAPFQHSRRERLRREMTEETHAGVLVERQDFRRKIRERRTGSCIVLAVDASGSMGANERMTAAKGAVLSLLMDAYQKRDKVALVAFRGQSAEVLLPPTSSVELAYRALEELPTGGRTPLAHGLETAHTVLMTQLRRDAGAVPVLVLISDGRGNVARYGGKPLHEVRDVAEGIRDDIRIRSIVIDTEPEGLLAFGLARGVADMMGAAYHRIEDLKAQDIVMSLRHALQ